MQITPATIPGTGTLHHARTRHGQRLSVLAHRSGSRTLYLYDTPHDTAELHHIADPDSPAHGIVLERDEADQLAQLLHDQPIADRLAALERRLAELTAAAPDDADHPHR